MAIKVLVKGDNSGDYEFNVSSYRKERCFNEEIIELLDSNGNLLYTVPASSLILIQYFPDDSGVELQEFVDGEYITQLCVDNNSSDIAIDCTRVSAERLINIPIIEAYQFLGIDQKTKQEKWFKEFTIPLSKVKFINHNFLIKTSENGTPNTSNETFEQEVLESTDVAEEKPMETNAPSTSINKNNSKKKKSKINKK